MWNTKHELVGQRVFIHTGGYAGDEETAVVLAVSTVSGIIRVRSEEDGEILTGNQWDHAD